MADKLLVRAYNVGVGDCIYCRIPRGRAMNGQRDDFHMLIDCGSWSGFDYLKDAMEHLKGKLPEAEGGKKRLDLLVVTHEHKDHIAGFDPKLFAAIQIENLWMSAATNLEHPQAGKALALHAFAARAMRDIERLNLSLSPELQDLVALFAVDNDEAMTALRETLPEASGIKPTYVHAGMSSEELGLPLTGATIHVLGPEQDIDHFYLGDEADLALRGLAAMEGARPAPPSAAGGAGPGILPGNISQAEFRQLRSRMVSSAFAFAELSSRVTNNTSVVLLIEWKKKRLLFVGDAEWDTGFKEGKSNGSWNVMWKQRRELLGSGVDFLKIGHHGSENATPWDDEEDGRKTEPAAILDAILPLPERRGRATAKAIVSTERGRYKTIPRGALLVELGKRVANVRNYQEELEAAGIDTRKLPHFREFERAWLNAPQPLRTDCEYILSEAPFVEVELET